MYVYGNVSLIVVDKRDIPYGEYPHSDNTRIFVSGLITDNDLAVSPIQVYEREDNVFIAACTNETRCLERWNREEAAIDVCRLGYVGCFDDFQDMKRAIENMFSRQVWRDVEKLWKRDIFAEFRDHKLDSVVEGTNWDETEQWENSMVAAALRGYKKSDAKAYNPRPNSFIRNPMTDPTSRHIVPPQGSVFYGDDQIKTNRYLYKEEKGMININDLVKTGMKGDTLVQGKGGGYFKIKPDGTLARELHVFDNIASIQLVTVQTLNKFDIIVHQNGLHYVSDKTETKLEITSFETLTAVNMTIVQADGLDSGFQKVVNPITFQMKELGANARDLLATVPTNVSKLQVAVEFRNSDNLEKLTALMGSFIETANRINATGTAVPATLEAKECGCCEKNGNNEEQI